MKKIKKTLLLSLLPSISLATACVVATSCSKDDLWKGKNAIIIDENNNYHYFSSLIDSKICSDNNEDIVDDANNVFARDKFNYQILLNPNLTNIPDNFLSDCTTFNKGVYINEGITSIGKNFLKGCIAFNHSIAIPSTTETIDEGFLLSCKSFDGTIDFNDAKKLVYINSSFLKDCEKFNNGGKKLILPSNLESIGGFFLTNCKTFNQEITLPTKLSYISGFFMSGCENFDQELNLGSLDKLTLISASFLENCKKFNHDIAIPKNVEIIFNNFLYGCTSFNKTIDFSKNEKMTIISEHFLDSCISFSQDITLPSTLQMIGGYFLNNCTAFGNTNKSIGIPENLSDIGSYFLGGIANKVEITVADGNKNFLKDNGWLVSKKLDSNFDILTAICLDKTYKKGTPTTTPIIDIQHDFMVGCSDLDEIVIPPTVLHIYDGFLANCKDYTKGITIPASVNSIGNNFLGGIVNKNEIKIDSGNTTFKKDNGLICCPIDKNEKDDYKALFFDKTYDPNVEYTIKNVVETDTNFEKACEIDKKIKLPTTIKTIGYGFLSYCKFGAGVGIDWHAGITEIKTYALFNSDFNQPIVLPSTLTRIGGSFLGEDKVFNQQIDFSNCLSLEKIDPSFMVNCKQYSQPLDFSKIAKQTITYIGNNFMFGCDNFTKINIGSITAEAFEADAPGMASFATDNENAICYTEHIQITAVREEVVSRFPELSGPKLYRFVEIAEDSK